MRNRERGKRGEWREETLWGAIVLETSYLGNSQEDGLTGDHMHMRPSKEDAAPALMCVVFLQNA